jgi:ketosteroid isomerase-like protein
VTAAIQRLTRNKTMPTPDEPLLQFIARINAHDTGGIVALCTVDHVFIDSLGNRISSAAQLAQGWNWYFAMFPDYRIEIQTVAVKGDTVLACGLASATHAPTGIAWSIPAAWRAKTANGGIAEWQVYADNKPVHELLARAA